MPLVNPVVLEKGLKTTFFKAFEAGTPIYPTFSTTVPSNADKEKYGWLGTAPAMREWTDERLPVGLIDSNFTITNRKYEASIEIDEDTLEDDQTSQITARVRDLGARASIYPDTLMTNLIKNGQTDLCYDGQAFFDTDHSEGDSGSQDNDLSINVTTTTAVTQAEAKEVVYKIRSQMMKYVDDRGEPFFTGINFSSANFAIMIPPGDHEEAFAEVSGAALINTGESNVLQNTFRLIVNPRLTTTTEVYGLYTGAAVKPFIFQTRRAMRTAMTGTQSDSVVMTGSRVFGVDARYAMGYGMWQYAVLVTLT